VHAAGLEVASRARTERLSEAVDQVLGSLQPGEVVAFQIDGAGAPPEIDRLVAAGADVIALPIYEWKLPSDDRPAVRLAEAVISGRVHAVTFTANPAIGNWMTIAAEHGIENELRDALTDRRVIVGCVGPVCAEAAVRHGLGSGHLVVPDTWRIGPLVRVVEQRLVTRIITVTVDGACVQLAGTTGSIDGELFTMSDVEARLLAEMARTPNVVRPKTDLLRAVWGAGASDPHVVEVTVARLRRKLGARGGAIASVHRRGYMLST
jgi:uroporphyrinogen-III synthase